MVEEGCQHVLRVAGPQRSRSREEHGGLTKLTTSKPWASGGLAQVVAIMDGSAHTSKPMTAAVQVVMPKNMVPGGMKKAHVRQAVV